jgi:hypothetical protein
VAAEDPCPGTGDRPRKDTITYRSVEYLNLAVRGNCPRCNRNCRLTLAGTIYQHQPLGGSREREEGDQDG